MRSGIQPGEAVAELLCLELSAAQIFLVDGGYLQLPSPGRLHVLGNLHHAVRVEIQAHNGVVALWLLRLFLDAEHVSVLVELCNAISLRIIYPISEYRGLVVVHVIHGVLQQGVEVVAVEDVVSQNQADAVVSNELFSYYKGLRQAVRRRLHLVTEVNPKVASIAEKPAERRHVFRGGNYEDVPDSGMHQHGNRVIDHRFVVYRQQLLAHTLGYRVKPCS